jgi:hypothetical protein
MRVLEREVRGAVDADERQHGPAQMAPAVADRQDRRVVPVHRRIRRLLPDVARDLVEHGVRESHFALADAGEALETLERLVDGRVRRDPTEVHELVRAHAQRPGDARLLAGHRQLEMEIEQRIERVQVPHRAVGDLLEQMPVARLEVPDARRERLVDEAPGLARVDQQLDRGAADGGSGRRLRGRNRTRGP